MRYTEVDFDTLSWHDCSIWGIELRPGDPDVGDWTSDLAFDIDFIVEWVCASPVPDGIVQFRVAPATLVFHGASDLKIDIDWGQLGAQVALQPASVAEIERAPIENQRIYLDRSYYRWRIALNSPQRGEITFGAVGFTQTLRAEPILSERQALTRAERIQLGGAEG